MNCKILSFTIEKKDFVEKIQKQEQKKNILNKEFAETLVVH